MEKLKEFLEINKISSTDLFEALHKDIREVLLRIICKKLKEDDEFFMWAKKTYFSNTSDLEATRKVVDKACKCRLSDTDIEWMNSCIRAFFFKRDHRENISIDTKKELLQKQNCKCAICGCEISLGNMHVDHVIPWDYVGDELKDNLQGLCADCNLSKSNHVAIMVTNLILHREVK